MMLPSLRPPPAYDIVKRANDLLLAEQRALAASRKAPVDPSRVNADLTPEWNTHRLLSDAGILDECLQRAERIMLNRRLAAAREVVADLERQIGGAS